MTSFAATLDDAHRMGGLVNRETDTSVGVGRLRLPGRCFLAPLSGITDVPFRRIARRFGAGLVVSEMVASGELNRDTSESLLRAMRDGPGLHAVQLAGRNAAWMAEAARRLAGEGVDLIDINFGCPAKKVVGGLSGSALMREPDLAAQIVEATVAGAGDVPVTVKMRLGWDGQSLNAPAIARAAEAAGVAMVTVHGRTRAQFYEGQADWAAIAAVRRAVSVPLVANGDLSLPADVPRMRAASGADAVMIGRGAQGRPWAAGLLSGAVNGDGLRAVPLGDLVAEHYAAMLAHYGGRAGLRHARKHLGWYVERLRQVEAGPAAAALAADARALMVADDSAFVLATLRRIFDGVSAYDVEPAFAEPDLRSKAA